MSWFNNLFKKKEIEAPERNLLHYYYEILQEGNLWEGELKLKDKEFDELFMFIFSGVEKNFNIIVDTSNGKLTNFILPGTACNILRDPIEQQQKERKEKLKKLNKIWK
jgi:hypothetical protein